MKTGTTSIQAAAQKRRNKLLSHGVRYPGHMFNQRRPLGALMGWSVDAWKRSGPLVPDLLDVETDSAPPRKQWDKLAAEMDADTERRIFISHEYVSQVDDATAQRIVDAIGERVHVCITLRPTGQIVPSLWSQGIRDDALTEPFDDWLTRVYGTDPDPPMPDRFWRAYDQGALVDRWAQLVGPENVTVIIADKSEPHVLHRSLESMLDLPAGMLHWRLTNRSLTAVEAELFRNVNINLRDNGADWLAFYNLLRKGALRFGPERRVVPADEPRVLLPPWAASIADKDGRRFADSIRGSGARVVGDLDKLAAESPANEWQDIDTVPIDVAANGIAGGVSAARQQARRFRTKIETQSGEVARLKQELATTRAGTLQQYAHSIAANQRAQQMASAFTTRELAAAMKRRLRHKLGKRRAASRNERD